MKKEIMIELMTMTDVSELRMVSSAINDRIKEVGQMVKYELKPGDTVMVEGGRKLDKDEGTVVRINRTRAVVDISGKHWDVPFSMITKQQEVAQ